MGSGAFIGAQLVNEPGTWNFSELNTRDPDVAARFYNAVFDWEVIKLEMGESAFSNQEIATVSFISLSTVKTHLASIQMKLHLRNRVEIAIWIFENDVGRPTSTSSNLRESDDADLELGCA